MLFPEIDQNCGGVKESFLACGLDLGLIVMAQQLNRPGLESPDSAHRHGNTVQTQLMQAELDSNQAHLAHDHPYE